MDTSRIRVALVSAAAAVVISGLRPCAAASPAPEPPAAEAQRLQEVLRSQHPQTGEVHIPGANATLRLGGRFYYLPAEEAKQVLKAWGNPPDSTRHVLGMVFPAGSTFLDRDVWAAVITYEQAGYISDEDADKADYQKLLDEAHEGEDAENAARQKDGFPSVHLVGWAEAPAYDRARHNMIWARDIRFADTDEDTLNYDVRVLGRRGYLSLNVIADMSQLPQIRPAAAELASRTSFDPGSAYGDYQPGADRKAEFGVAGLVAAGLGLAAAQKFGLLAAVALFAKKGLVLIAAGVAALAARFRKLFRKDPPTPA